MFGQHGLYCTWIGCAKNGGDEAMLVLDVLIYIQVYMHSSNNIQHAHISQLCTHMYESIYTHHTGAARLSECPLVPLSAPGLSFLFACFWWPPGAKRERERENGGHGDSMGDCHAANIKVDRGVPRGYHAFISHLVWVGFCFFCMWIVY